MPPESNNSTPNPPSPGSDQPVGSTAAPKLGLPGSTPGSSGSSPPPPRKPDRSWAKMKARANTVSGVVTLLVSILIIGAVIGWWVNSLRQPPATKSPIVQTLTDDELKKLTNLSTNIGSTNQVLNIGANALFRGAVNVTSDLTVGGRFNANGPVTLSQLNITGTTALTGLNVGSNLTVGGVTTLQQGVTISGLAAINGGLNVSGTASVNALNASTISVRTLSLSGPLIISHITTQGAAPTATAGSAVGGGGTISLSGNDTTGTLNINTGAAPPAGVLATVVFRTSYTGGVHVMLSPLTGASASLPAYVTRTATGFQVRVDSPPPAGTVFAFDYLVVQ